MLLKFITADRVFNCMGTKYQVVMTVELGYIYILCRDMDHVIYT